MKLVVLLLAFLVSVSYQTDSEVRIEDNNSEVKQVRQPGQRDPRFFFLFNTISSTKTSWTTVTSTATTVTIISCIPTGLFVAGSSTKSCRKRRGILEEFDHELISPSRTAEVVPTALPAEVQRDEPIPDLSSSLGDDEHEHLSTHVLHKRFLYAYTTTTLTSTFTSLIFTSTAYTSTVSPVLLAQLVCLPAGYKTC